MYIVLVFIGVVSLRYDNAAEWFQMAKSSTTYLLKPAKNRLTSVCFMWFHEFFQIKIAMQRPAVDVDMYIALIFIGVVYLGYDNIAEWFLCVCV